MTKRLSGHEVAEMANRVLPGCVARADDVACYFEPAMWREAAQALHDDAASDLKHLTNMCGVDYWDRFECVYHVQSLMNNHIATLKVEIREREKPVCQSAVPVWYGAWMQECEAYDMFGIKFEGHPNLHRILLWDGFPGWPQRKDFLSMPGGLQPGLNEFSGTARREPPPVKVVE